LPGDKGANQLVCYVIVPASLPVVFAALRVSTSGVVVLIVASEPIAASAGVFTFDRLLLKLGYPPSPKAQIPPRKSLATSRHSIFAPVEKTEGD